MIFHRLLVVMHIIGYLIRKRKNPVTYGKQVCSIHKQTNFTYSEIIGYELAGKSEEKLETFLSDEDYISIARNHDLPSEAGKVTNKIYALKQLGNLIHREWLDLRKCSDEEFIDFYQRHKEIFLKQYRSAQGRFIYYYCGEKSEQELKKLINDAKRKELYLAEQPIVQHETIARLCPYCINPVRIHTINNGNEISIMYISSISFGAKKSHISNLGNGGTAIIEDGRISTDLFVKEDPFLRMRKCCKGTNEKVKGVEIPYFAEAEMLVKQAAMYFPTLPYLAFDIAITPDGPEIIEINAISGFLETGQKITNYLFGTGTRSEIMKMFDVLRNQQSGERENEETTTAI